MASSREIRRRIKGVKKIQQITRAMKMVATVKFKRAFQSLISARPYANKIDEIISDLASRIEDAHHPFMFKQKENGKSGINILVVITADKGLCGSFNSNIIRKTINILKENKDGWTLFIIGRKARDYFSRFNFNIKKTYVNLPIPLTYKIAEQIADELINSYLNENVKSIFILYNEFKTALTQNIKYDRLLPLSSPRKLYSKIAEHLYEPTSVEVLDNLLPAYVKFRVFRSILESNASEQGARMSMMDQATKSAEDMISDLTLHFNKARQANITRELTEISTSAEAIKV